MNQWMKVAALAMVCGWTLEAAAQTNAPAPYIRVKRPDANTTQIETCVRKFTREGSPDIWLAGVAHIGTPAYYEAIQKHLDGVDRVLYEGVGMPSFLKSKPPTTDAERVKYTNALLHFLKEAAIQDRRKENHWPTGLDMLADDISKTRKNGVMRKMRSDAWGHEIVWEVLTNGCRIASYGADGTVGGEGVAADISVQAVDPLPADKDGVSDIQSAVAQALELKFQLEAINYDRPHFANSDVTVEELKEKLKTANPGNGEADAVLKNLINGNGNEFSGMILNLIKMVGADPKMRALMKSMMIETLGQADDLMGAKDGPLGALGQVLITDRNNVVMSDLKGLLQSEGRSLRSISLFYGAAHMAEMERALVETMGYRPAADEWITAFGVDTAAAGVSPAEIQMIRMLISVQKEQLKNMQKKKPARTPLAIPAPAIAPKTVEPAA